LLKLLVLLSAISDWVFLSHYYSIVLLSEPALANRMVMSVTHENVAKSRRRHNRQ